jgi:hypothetical protein
MGDVARDRHVDAMNRPEQFPFSMRASDVLAAPVNTAKKPSAANGSTGAPDPIVVAIPSE